MTVAGDIVASPSWRAETGADGAFLLGLTIACRQPDFAMLPLTGEQRMALLEGQHRMQRAHYRASYRQAELLVVEQDGVPIGRLCLDRGTAADLRIVDIALLPDRRGHGIGTALLHSVLSLAEREGRTASLHVDPGNPARRLYERLGFRFVGQRGPDWFMVRSSRR